MTKLYAATMLLALLGAHAHCQTPEKAPAFEIASITPCPPGTPAPSQEHMGLVQFTYPGGRLSARATTVKALVEWAYGIQTSQLAGGPDWIATDRYDVEAKAAVSATDAEIKRMTQILLADRFHLKLHHENRALTALVISAGKTPPKLTPAKEDEKRGMQVAPQTGPDQKIASYRIKATRFSIPQLADLFSRQLHQVILDQTGLAGDFDFTLELVPDESRPNPMDATLLIGLMREQLGLTLKSQKVPVGVLVIDSVERVAAGN